MKMRLTISIFAVFFSVAALAASDDDYSASVADILTVQDQAVEQAREIVARLAGTPQEALLEAAITEMQRSRAALDAAKGSPDKLPAALAAEQSAYNALLKAIPPEYRMAQGRNGSGSSMRHAGDPDQAETDELELTPENSRYETEQQATAPANAQQRAQQQALERLKQLARRQEDLNDRLQEAQTALQQARTDRERDEIQRQIKRLRDEEHQMLTAVDDLRQQIEQIQDPANQAKASQQLEQAHNDVQRAAQELGNQSVSQALAAGSRAEEKLQNLREQLRQQFSSQFASQMREMRRQARDLSTNEDQIGHDLEALNNSDQKSLNDAGQRAALVAQMARQQSALTNLLQQMQAVSDQAESTEPLLSKQLYDTLRRTEQAQPGNQLEIGGQLADRGFLPQAAQAERAARNSITDLRQGVERAAESVLGSESEALRYAQNELDDLAKQLGRERKGANGSPNSAAGASGNSAGSAPADNGNAQGNNTGNGSQGESLSQIAQSLGGAHGVGGLNGPITGRSYMDWADRMRDVEEAVDSPDIRNQLATVREQVAAYRRAYRQEGKTPSDEDLKNKALAPLALAQQWVAEELARAQNNRSLVPLDRDPVQDKYSEMVRKYYEKLGSAQ
jgi:hypothetical protein